MWSQYFMYCIGIKVQGAIKSMQYFITTHFLAHIKNMI